MLRKKDSMPQEGECVFCTISKIQYHSVFANLDEYKNKSGMIHISEISPGRIRNINDYVKEGKVVVCKVLRIDKEKGHIDLSLRRVNESQRRAKVEERKQETITENIVKSYCELHKLDLIKTYENISKILLKKYSSLYDAFEDFVENKVSLTSMGLEDELAKGLEKIISERIKPKKVSIKGDFKIHSFEENGIDLISKAMEKALKISDNLSIKFAGAGKYNFEIVAPDYEEAESIYEETVNSLESSFNKTETQFSVQRE